MLPEGSFEVAEDVELEGVEVVAELEGSDVVFLLAASNGFLGALATCHPMYLFLAINAPCCFRLCVVLKSSVNVAPQASH